MALAGAALLSGSRRGLLSVVDNIAQYKEILDFSNPDHAYVLSYTVRKKDDPEHGVSRFKLQISKPENEFFRTRVVSNMAQFDRYIEQFMQDGDQKGYQYRIYGTFNPHSLRRAYIELTKRVTELILWEPSQADQLLGNFEAEFRSYVHKPISKAITRYHMLDADTPDLRGLLQSLPKEVEVQHIFKSKSGYNILYKPCNPAFVQDLKTCEFMRDSQVNVFIK